MLSYLQGLVGNVITVNSIKDIGAAFDADARKPMGKTVIEWNM